MQAWCFRYAEGGACRSQRRVKKGLSFLVEGGAAQPRSRGGTKREQLRVFPGRKITRKHEVRSLTRGKTNQPQPRTHSHQAVRVRAIIKIQRGGPRFANCKAPPPHGTKRQRCRMPSGWPARFRVPSIPTAPGAGSFSRKKVSSRIPFVSCLYPIVFLMYTHVRRYRTSNALRML